MAELFIQEPKDKAEKIILSEEIFSIGRDETNDLVIPEQKVSKFHAKIISEGGSYFINDLKSTNGTIVNQRKVIKVKLLNNATIQVGSFIMKFVESQQATVEMESPFIPEKDDDFEEESVKTLLEDSPPVFQEFDRDTVPTYMPDMIQKRNFPRLFITSAKEFGKDFLVDKEELILGSDDECDIVLKYSFISRKHAKLIRISGDYTVTDQKSTNGVFVNGKRVKEKKLYPGDILSLGQLHMRFTDVGEIFSPIQEEKKKKGIQFPVFRIVLILLIVLFAAGGFFIYEYQHAQEQKILQRKQMFAKKNTTAFEAGKKYLEQQNWEDAITEFQKIDKNSHVYADVPPLVEQAETEIESRQEYYRLLDALEKSDFQTATTQATRIPPSSFYHTESMKKLSEKKGDFLISLKSDTEKFIDDEDWESARGSIETAMILDPDNPDFAALSNTLEAKKAEAEKRAATMSKKQQQQAKYRATLRRANSHYADSATLYQQGKTTEAIEKLDNITKMGLSSKEKLLQDVAARKKLIQSLVTYYNNGNDLFNQGQHQDAINKWEELLKKEKTLVSGKSSAFYREIAPKMTDHYCRAADEKYQQKKLPMAYELWNRALGIDPDKAEAKRGLAKLNQEAQDLYREGYTAAGYNNIDRAKGLWREVLTIVPPSNEYYKKAQEKLIEYE